MARVIVDDPLAPERGQGVDLQHTSAPAGMHLHGRGWGGIETYPSIAGKTRCHPRVRVAAPNQILGSKVVKLAGAETVHHSRGNAQSAQHDGHRRSEVFTVPLLALKKKIGYGIARNSARKLQRISKMRPQIRFHRARLF